MNLERIYKKKVKLKIKEKEKANKYKFPPKNVKDTQIYLIIKNTS